MSQPHAADDSERIAAQALLLFAPFLVLFAYAGFFKATYFAQDDYIWLCFAKFCDAPALSLLYRDSLAGQFFRPVGQYWWMAVHAVSGDRVEPYQLAYLGTHLVNSVLAGMLIVRLCGRLLGAMTGLFVALNPIFVTPVSWYYLYVFDTLGCTGFLASLLLLVRCIRGGRVGAGLASLACALAAYFTKESYLMLPAAAALVVGIPESGGRWRFAEARRHWRWLAAFSVLAVAAWSWRCWVIGGFGGYGLWTFLTSVQAIEHFGERIVTLTGFTGWSCFPALRRWDASENAQLAATVPLLMALIWLARRSSTGPGPWWCLAWIAATWSPSGLMTTYAAVSFYPCLLGATLLLAQALAPWRHGMLAAVSIAFVYAGHGWFQYADRAPEIAVHRAQHQELRERFPPSEWSQGDQRQLVLMIAHPDLFPDAAVKYAAAPGTSFSSILLYNTSSPTNWVVMDRGELGPVGPLAVSPVFQNGYMEMPPYRSWPLFIAAEDMLAPAEGLTLRFLTWQWSPQKRFVEVPIDKARDALWPPDQRPAEAPPSR
ncbi:MAG: hypothetical protein KF774_20905 [Planctomyces sp.]|nr:hypothetical protein [Planctomyces sp.]